MIKNHLLTFAAFFCLLFVGRLDFALALESNGRFAIMRFEGTSSLILNNQPFRPLNKAAPDQSGETPSDTQAVYVLVADTEKKEVQLYAKMALWRMDTGGIDETKEYLWHETIAGATMLYENDLVPIPAGSLWAFNVRSVFADVFDLPVDGEITALVSKIALQCEEANLGVKSENFTSGDRLQQRSVDDDGKKLTVNNFFGGQILSAVHVEKISAAKESSAATKKFNCKSMMFFNEKPTEIRTGVLSVERSTALPIEIALMKTSSVGSDVGPTPSSRLTTTKDVTPTKGGKNGRSKSDNSWNVAALIVGGLIFLVAIVSRTILKSKENKR